MNSVMALGCNSSLNPDSKSGLSGTNTGEETSDLEQDTLFHDEYSVRIVGQVLIFLLAVPLNSIVIYTFLGNNSQQTRVSCLVGHLCAINLAYALFSIPFDIIWHITVQWFAGTICCKLLMFVRLFLFLSGPYMLVCISVDRLLAIVFPLQMMVTGDNVTTIMCATVYTVSAVLALPQGLLYEALNMKTFLQEQQAQGQQVTMTSLRSDHVTSTTTPVPIPPSMLPPRFNNLTSNCDNNKTLNGSPEGTMEIPDFTQCVTFGTLSQTGSKIYLLYTMIVQFFIPVVLMIICYVIIIAKLTMKNRRERQDRLTLSTRGEGSTRSNGGKVSEHLPLRRSNEGHLERARNKMMFMTACIVSTYIICSTPYYLSVLLLTIYSQDENDKSLSLKILNEILNIFQMSSVVADPIIYGIFTARPEGHPLRSCCGNDRADNAAGGKSKNGTLAYSMTSGATNRFSVRRYVPEQRNSRRHLDPENPNPPQPHNSNQPSSSQSNSLSPNVTQTQTAAL